MAGFSSNEIPCGYRVLSELTSDYPEIEIEPFGDGVKNGSFSIDSLGDLAELSILRSKEEFWKNKQILNLVRMYLDSSLQALEFFTLFQECLGRARTNHSILQSAIKVFKKDNPASHKKTLDNLKDFIAAKDPFSDKFFAQFEYIYKQQIDTLDKLAEEKSRLDEKLKSNKAWKKVSNLLLIAALVAAVILMVIAAVLLSPMVTGLAAASAGSAGLLAVLIKFSPMIAGLATAVAAPLGLIQPWMTSFWSKKGKKVSSESDIVGTMRDYTDTTTLEMENIPETLNIIMINLESLSKMADFRVKNQEEGLKTTIDEMKKISKGLSRSIDKLEKTVVRSSRYISWARKKILKKVEKYQNEF